MKVDLSKPRSSHSLRNKMERVLWGIVWRLLYRPSPRPFHAWRRLLLRMFGAEIGSGARPYPAAKIWLPRNLTMGAHSRLANDVDCYCVADVEIGAHVVVSSYSFLCTATHDYEHPHFPLKTAPIHIEEEAWVAADAFIGPGVTVGKGGVIGARSSVYGDVSSWTVVAGNPASVVKQRVIQTEGIDSQSTPSSENGDA